MEIKKQEQKGKLEGVVLDNKRWKEGTIKVLVENRRPHPKYHKIITTRKKYLVQYDEKQDISIGSLVVLVQIASKSRRKNFKIEKILRVRNIKE